MVLRAVVAAATYRVLRAPGTSIAGHLDRHNPKVTGFVQPLGPHVHWLAANTESMKGRYTMPTMAVTIAAFAQRRMQR